MRAQTSPPSGNSISICPGDVPYYDGTFLKAYRIVRQWLKAGVELMHAAWRMR